MQEILQIKNGNITISNGTSDYSDTVANFTLDSGVKLDNIDFVMYNRTDKVLIKDNKIINYVINNTYDNIIDDLKNINDKKCYRLTPPHPHRKTSEELRKEALKKATEEFTAQKENILTAYAIASLSGNQSFMAKAQTDYKALILSYSEAIKKINGGTTNERN